MTSDESESGKAVSDGTVSDEVGDGFEGSLIGKSSLAATLAASS
jgi:hypothetical protein